LKLRSPTLPVPYPHHLAKETGAKKTARGERLALAPWLVDGLLRRN
jgi:hypothetical protein